MTTTAVAITPSEYGDRILAKWLLMANGNDGTAIQYGSFSDRSVQVTGTFGAGGSVNIEGSNDGGTTWAVLTDPSGSDLTFTSTGLQAITELTDKIRPKVTAGDVTTSINVYLFMRGNQP